jgi:hypothetical protein
MFKVLTYAAAPLRRTQFTLPLHDALTSEQVDYIIDVIKVGKLMDEKLHFINTGFLPVAT